MMKETPKLLFDYADMICEMFGEKAVAEMAINPGEDAGTTIKKLMHFNIKMAKLFSEELDTIYEQIYD